MAYKVPDRTMQIAIYAIVLVIVLSLGFGLITAFAVKGFSDMDFSTLITMIGIFLLFGMLFLVWVLWMLWAAKPGEEIERHKMKQRLSFYIMVILLIGLLLAGIAVYLYLS
jgi:membrane protease YdiL (CAAX protease family)